MLAETTSHTIWGYAPLDVGTFALALATFLLVVTSVFALRSARKSDARRAQPVVIANQLGKRSEAGYRAFLTNEGTGTAFNVRFGVRVDGTEYSVGEGRGHRYVIGPGSRVPDASEGHLYVLPHFAAYVLGEGGVDARAEFWARYENSFGESYETVNPADPLKDFTIKRVRPARLRRNEKKQARRRERDRKKAEQNLTEEVESLGRRDPPAPDGDPEGG